MSAIPSTCPSCQHQMVITQLTCTNCNTNIAGYYPVSPFAHLSEENLRFLENFIRYRGNVKEMERELGQSYWTIRTRLDKLITEMGLSAQPQDLEAQRKLILEQLSSGEIGVEEATQKLTNLGKK
ncbi:MAG: DUF2089 domain-containing protein [Anaerolineales bacterium]|nr:DUF2089 domain-containing protein [Anaerolineales bacterium]